jgi:putative holliday junction resolvase
MTAQPASTLRKNNNVALDPPGRIAGIDFGTVRIGIAIADSSGTIASPYENYTRRGETLDRAHFVQLVKQEQIARFVVGLPIHLDGRTSAKSIEAERFGGWLAEATGIPVEYFDERFTTLEAERALADAELTKKQRKARLDKLAAQIMLTAYLESRQSGHVSDPRPRGLDDR